MPIDIQKMFSDFIPDAAQQDRQEGLDAVAALKQLGGTAAMLAPVWRRRLRKGAGGMFGVDMRSPAEKLQETLAGVDVTTPEGQDEAFRLISNVDGNAGIQFRIAMQEQARAAQSANAQSAQANAAATNAGINAATFNQTTADRPIQREALANLAETSNLPPDRVSALARAARAGLFDNNPAQLVDRLDSAAKDRFQIVGAHIYDNKEQQWISPPEVDNTGSVDLEKLNPDAYDPASLARYQSLILEATSPQEKIDALNVLLPKAKDDWSWRQADSVLPNGQPRYVQWPTGEALQEKSTEVRKANAAGNTQRRKAGEVVNVLDGIEAALNSGDIKTEIQGIVLSQIPGTSNYTFEGDLDTIRANLGINALQEARDNSVNGASGFGQLTERELARLESLIASLKVGMSKAELEERLARVKASFIRARDEAYSDWTLEQWLGLEAPTRPSTQSNTVTTGSGNEFTIQ